LQLCVLHIARESPKEGEEVGPGCEDQVVELNSGRRSQGTVPIFAAKKTCSLEMAEFADVE
jgi:hypothetical protein